MKLYNFIIISDFQYQLRSSNKFEILLIFFLEFLQSEEHCSDRRRRHSTGEILFQKNEPRLKRLGLEFFFLLLLQY